MGIPSITTFCENGHIVSSNAHHEMPDEKVTNCTVCNSTNLISVWEWGDEDNLVPFEPISSDEHVCDYEVEIETNIDDINQAIERCDKFEEIRVWGNLVRQVSVYDVSKLFVVDDSYSFLKDIPVINFH